MLTRLHVDNYKALVNFDLELSPRCFLFGANGTGKTSVLEVMDFLRRLMAGGKIDLGEKSRTRWETREEQHFEVQTTIEGHRYTYQIEVGLDWLSDEPLIKRERLTADDGRALFVAENGKASLYWGKSLPEQEVMVATEGSGLPLIAARTHHPEISRFVNWFRDRVLVCRVNPLAIRTLTERDATTLATDASNFADWWRHIHDEDSDAAQDLRAALAESLPGFSGLEFKRESEKVRRLTVRFGGTSFDFDELSEGQRALIVLHAILVSSKRSPKTVFFDEPDNFVSIREIQPFYNALEACDDLQAVVISHHPTLTNLMAPEHGIVFSRGTNAPVRTERFSMKGTGTATVSELVAQGWFDEPR